MGNILSGTEAEEPVVPEPEIDEESVAASLIQKSWKKQQTAFEWHDHLYDEIMEMAETGAMVHYLSHLFQAARTSEKGLKGLDLALPSLTEDDGKTSKTTKLLLAQIIPIVESNKELLKKSGDFKVNPDDMIKALKRIGERTSTRKVSVVGLDADKLKKQDMFFFVVKDDKLKRIILSFPNNPDTVKYNKKWVNQNSFKMTKVSLDRALKAKITGDRISEVGLHSGFHSYLFSAAKGGSPSKMAEIVATLKPIMESNPKHRLFVTGHGVGAAMAQIVAFFLTFKSKDIPLPVSSIGFSTPRVGDAAFWRACQLMEMAGKFRTLRVTQASDSMPIYPSAKEYIHAGHQVLLDASTKAGPKASYPTVKDDGVARLGRFGKKPKDYKEPKDYMSMIEKNKDPLMKMHLNRLYEDIGVSSFLAPEPKTETETTAVVEKPEAAPEQAKPEAAPEVPPQAAAVEASA